MKQYALGILTLVSALSARAQPVFSASSLPSRLGQYYRGYSSTNASVAGLLTITNGPQVWDLSQPPQPFELIQRTDIIAPSNSPDTTDFPQASYAEQDTLEPTNQIAWRYFSLTDQGRLFYGTFTPLPVDVTEAAVFDPPALDVPGSVQFGQTWQRSFTWSSTVNQRVPLLATFNASATVDGYGTLFLPVIGGVPALRVHEVQAYESSELENKAWVTVLSYTNQYYYWLAPNLGIAAQVYLFGSTVPSIPPPMTNSLLRVFQANYFTNSAGLGAVNGLSILLQGGSVLLDWPPVPSASSYQVQFTASVAQTNTNWQLLGSPATNSWSDPLTATQRFYRVLAEP